MLSTVFIGRENEFNRIFADWLATQSHLRGVVWADKDRYSNAWRRRWMKRSLKQVGLFQTLDRIRFNLWANRSDEMKMGWRRMCQDAKEAYPCENAREGAEEVRTASIKTSEVEQFLTRIAPDLIIVNCISQLIPAKICALPRLGLYIYHEGLTPEYKGMHTPFWAIANGDDDKVGYTLLKADDTFDGGEVYVQGATSVDPLATSLGYTGHWALAEGFPKIGAFLQELEVGRAQPIDTTGRRDGYYSYFPYSRYKAIQKRREARGLRVGPDDVIARDSADSSNV